MFQLNSTVPIFVFIEWNYSVATILDLTKLNV